MPTEANSVDYVDQLLSQVISTPFYFTASELVLIFWEATHNRMWAQATMPEWEAAISEAIKTGLIESKNGKLGVVSAVEEAKPQQMGLFE